MENIEVTPTGAKVFGTSGCYNNGGEEARLARDSWREDSHNAMRSLDQARWNGE
jgi:hypothetical protein